MYRQLSPIIMIMMSLTAITSIGVAQMSQPNEVNITMSGATLKASSIAYLEFEHWLSKKSNGNELDNFLNDATNYSAAIKESPTEYSISFYPSNYKGQRLKGGGATYRISKIGYRVIDSIYYK